MKLYYYNITDKDDKYLLVILKNFNFLLIGNNMEELNKEYIFYLHLKIINMEILEC